LKGKGDEEKARSLGARAYFVKALVDPRQLVVDIQNITGRQSD